MLVVLKIPVVYLCAVVWWAIKAEPEPLEGAPSVATLPDGPSCDWRSRHARLLRRGPLPRGGRGRRPTRPSRAAYARAQVGT
jgi:hypothetical protein